MNFQDGISQIRKGTLVPHTLILGTESYLRQQLLDAILEQVEGWGSYEASRFDLNEVGLVPLLDEADSFSFFAERRLILVDNAQLLLTASKYKIEEADQARLLTYLEDPNPSTLIVWLCDSNQVDKRKKLTKAFQKQSQWIEVAPLTGRELERYLQSYVANQSLAIQRDALQELILRVNEQLTLAMSELHKLEQYSRGGKPITLAVVKQLVPRSLETDVFTLIQAVLSRQLSRAVAIYQDLLLAKNEPIALHALLVSQFRLFIQVKLLSQQGYQRSDIAHLLGVHPYRVKLALETIHARSLSGLYAFYDQLAETDFQLKQGLGLKEVQFDLLISRYMGQTGYSAP